MHLETASQQLHWCTHRHTKLTTHLHTLPPASPPDCCLYASSPDCCLDVSPSDRCQIPLSLTAARCHSSSPLLACLSTRLLYASLSPRPLSAYLMPSALDPDPAQSHTIVEGAPVMPSRWPVVPCCKMVANVSAPALSANIAFSLAATGQPSNMVSAFSLRRTVGLHKVRMWRSDRAGQPSNMVSALSLQKTVGLYRVRMWHKGGRAGRCALAAKP